MRKFFKLNTNILFNSCTFTHAHAPSGALNE